MPAVEIGPLSWTVAAPASSPLAPMEDPDLVPAPPTCSGLALPTQTLAPSANTNRTTYLHCLTKVNSPTYAQSLPSPQRAVAGPKVCTGIFFRNYFLLARLLDSDGFD